MALTLTYPNGGALIIGGTGRVGEGITWQMALAGVPLVFTYGGKSETRAVALEAELRAAGHDVTRQQLDFRNAAATAQVIQSVADRHGRLHSLFCAGGPEVPFAKMADFKPEEIDRFFEYDALAHFRLYRETVLAMRQSGGGSITVCTTIANSRIIDYDGISAISKAAVESISKQIAAEEGGFGIRCNTVQISWTAPETMAETLRHLPRPDKAPETYTEMMADMLNNHFERSRLKRNSRPEEAGFLFAFLASDQASYLTGQSLVFDGGITL